MAKYKVDLSKFCSLYSVFFHLWTICVYTLRIRLGTHLIFTMLQDVKHNILFLVEMLEPFLDPAMTPVKSAISFGNVSSIFLEKQERHCAIALNVLRAAISKPAVLPSLEAEWRRGSVSPR